ncbi:ribose-phosphate diphosphokinase [Spiroplasma endosymbiont of Labia minor]|uniref:ribose-phosphate diphosphokinase n=1 Tax=Spiroplasma endosymbiont of Labia minor TaxID=3066305 RepID=UPI0030CE275A
MSKENLKYNIFPLSNSHQLTEEICEILKTKPKSVTTMKFADGEMLVQAQDTVRGREIYLIQSTSAPVNENLMELLIALDAFKRASAQKINVVIPYYGYARQDRKSKGRQPITSRLIANLLERAGAQRIIIVDMHSEQSMGFFDIPSDNLNSAQVLASEIVNTIIENNLDPKDCMLISPDQGGLKRVHSVGRYLESIIKDIGVIAKRRPEPNVAEVEFVNGNVEDKICFIIDDMIDTGGTILAAGKALKKEGAKEVYIFAGHGLFNGKAPERMANEIKAGTIKRVVVTNTIEIPENKIFPGLKVISVAKLLADMISASVEFDSLTGVYEQYHKEINERINLYLSSFKK